MGNALVTLVQGLVVATVLVVAAWFWMLLRLVLQLAEAPQ
jgi:hypothetical protein